MYWYKLLQNKHFLLYLSLSLSSHLFLPYFTNNNLCVYVYSFFLGERTNSTRLFLTRLFFNSISFRLIHTACVRCVTRNHVLRLNNDVTKSTSTSTCHIILSTYYRFNNRFFIKHHISYIISSITNMTISITS